MQLVYFSPCIWRWIFWYREWSEIENFITISSIKISIIWEYACWHNTNARWQISSFCLNGHWKFWKHESIACQNIEKQFYLMCATCASWTKLIVLIFDEFFSITPLLVFWTSVPLPSLLNWGGGGEKRWILGCFQ